MAWTRIPGDRENGFRTARIRIRLCFRHRFRRWSYDYGRRQWASTVSPDIYQATEMYGFPILTSCCPAWVNFFEHNFPELKDVPSTARSPQQMFGSIAKTYFAKKLGIDRNNLVVVSIMPCLAKKYECQRSEFLTDGTRCWFFAFYSWTG